MSKLWKIIGLIIVIVGVLTLFKTLGQPCSRPVTYSIGNFDERFGLPQTEFLSGINMAEATWEKAAKKELFTPSTQGRLTINLIYDSRQAATEILQKMGLTIEDNQQSYNSLKIRYDALRAQYDRDRSALQKQSANYEKKKTDYEQNVTYWNARGGAPKNEFERLIAEKNSLNTEAAIINNQQDALNEMVGQINALASTLNRLAAELNINVQQYNTVGTSRGEEFEEGVYEQDASGRRINIYEYGSREKLIRVLAHEFGHALGLEHVEDPEAIMYRLNESKNDQPTAADLQTLKATCRL